MKGFIVALLIVLALSCCNPITINKHINGKTEEAIINKYGEPQEESIIKLTGNTSLYEYQSNLYKLYPNISKGDTVFLKQLFWEYKTVTKWQYG